MPPLQRTADAARLPNPAHQEDDEPPGSTVRRIGVHPDLSRRALAAFREDVASLPNMTLRGGYAVDGYQHPPPYDAWLDAPTDDYLEAYTFWGLIYLDPASWRHYLPYLVDYALRYGVRPALHASRANTPAEAAAGAARGLVIEGLLSSLRPPDSDPPRLAALSPEQESVVVALLDTLAFDERSNFQSEAQRVLEEYWVPKALYRPQD